MELVLKIIANADVITLAITNIAALFVDPKRLPKLRKKD